MTSSRSAAGLSHRESNLNDGDSGEAGQAGKPRGGMNKALGASGRGRLGQASLLALLLALSACTAAEQEPPARGTKLQAQVASYDLHSGKPLRFIVGLLTQDGGVIRGGKVKMRFFFLGKGRAGKARPGPEAVGDFLPIPKERDGHEHAGGTQLPEGTGVYAATVRFDRPGFWEVEVTARDAKGNPGTARAAFEVLETNRVPAPGDPAPRSDNPTLSSTDMPRGAIDSRAEGGEIPDPQLHQSTIRDALERGRPVLAVFSTPVYCVSRFCGPITDMVAGLAKDYSDRAAFIHVEIWRDRQANAINEAAAEWLLREGDLQEPWVFLIGSDGRVAARWDNVATRSEIEPWLKKLAPSA
jgi:hypothetical protein